jgi:hypothetical protein
MLEFKMVLRSRGRQVIHFKATPEYVLGIQISNNRISDYDRDPYIALTSFDDLNQEEIEKQITLVEQSLIAKISAAAEDLRQEIKTDGLKVK